MPSGTDFLVGIPVVVALWLLVGAVSSEFSGWRALARRFTAVKRPQGAVLVGQVLGLSTSGGLLGLQGRQTTRLIVTPLGLYLESGALPRLGAPPLLLPWDQIEPVVHRSALSLHAYELRLAGGSAYLHVTTKAFEEMRPFFPSPVGRSSSRRPPPPSPPG